MAEPVDPPAISTEESPTTTEVFNSVKVSLADLCAKGTAHYAHKNFEEAADLYARASELQAELNGEMSPENAEILFLYGRSLFKVGQGKSDVLGGRAGGEKKKPNSAANTKKGEVSAGGTTSEVDQVTEEGVAIIADQNGGSLKIEEDSGLKKPLFQFTGDENFEDSDDDDVEGAEGDAEANEEEDDLAASFEVLDLARVLFMKRLDQPEEGEDKGKAIGDSPMIRHFKERLADTHDLLAEISLENERFPGAVTDFRAALALKKELYSQESEIIAEAHFKLSLALEFSSISRTKEDGEESTNDPESHFDQTMRDEAVNELQAAIDSTKLKLQNKEVELASCSSPDENDITRAQIADVKEIVADMEGRLAELKRPPIEIKEALYGQAGASGGNAMGGILSEILGESPAEAQARIEEAKKNATDLTGLVRRKKTAKSPETGTPEPSANGTNGKRKAEDDSEESVKKARVENILEE